MLDIKFIRENLDLIKEAARKKHVVVDLESLIKIDDQRRQLLQKIEEKKFKQNLVSEKMPSADEKQKEQLLSEMKILKTKLQTEENELRDILREWQNLMLQIPNVPDVSVPEGDTDAENKEIKIWGEIPKFSFIPKDHVSLLKDLDLADLEKGAEIAGFRGYVLKNEGAKLIFALMQFALDKISAKGYSPMIVPSVLRKEIFVGTGYLPQFEDDLYRTQDDAYLSGTAEVGVMGYFSNSVLAKEKLPTKVVAFSPCYRREAGAHGKDTRGLIRVHEFYKIEQVILCEALHEESVKFHEELLANSEELLQALKIPYHVVVNCGADIGLGQVKKYDIECWVPSEQKYRETHSASYFHDFQTRRLNIKYENSEGKKVYAHSLNNTAIATPRILVPILENYQQADGSIIVPEVLRPYLGGQSLIKKD